MCSNPKVTYKGSWKHWTNPVYSGMCSALLSKQTYGDTPFEDKNKDSFNSDLPRVSIQAPRFPEWLIFPKFPGQPSLTHSRFFIKNYCSRWKAWPWLLKLLPARGQKSAWPQVLLGPIENSRVDMMSCDSGGRASTGPVRSIFILLQHPQCHVGS